MIVFLKFWMNSPEVLKTISNLNVNVCSTPGNGKTLKTFAKLLIFFAKIGGFPLLFLSFKYFFRNNRKPIQPKKNRQQNFRQQDQGRSYRSTLD